MILALDTATSATVVALCPATGADPVELRDDPAPGARPAHASRLLPMVAEVLERSGAGWDDVERIAVGVGPGTFTGLRIGITTARALAQARSLPVAGISTLQSLAVGAGRVAAGGAVLAVLDARRGEAFAAAWPAGRVGALEAALAAPQALAPAALGELARRVGPVVLAVGEGAIKFRDVLERSGAGVPEDRSELHRVSAINHCRIARDTPAGPPEGVRPEYLRLPDAEIARRARTS